MTLLPEYGDVEEILENGIKSEFNVAYGELKEKPAIFSGGGGGGLISKYF